jgi:Spy/CpxP family protein refolding chaperone
MKTRKIRWIIAAVLLAVGGGFVYELQAAKTGALGSGRFHGLIAQRIAEKLGLNDGQIVEIKKVRNEEKAYVLAKLSDLHKARVDMRNVIQQQTGKVDEKAVRAAHAKVAAVEADLAVERAKIYAKISPILTPEQRDKVTEFQKRKDENVDWFLKNIGSHPALND